MAGPQMPQQTPPPRTPLGLRIALIVSLTLNLVVAGLVIGAMLGGDRDRRPETALSDIGFGPFVAALPGNDRRAFGTALLERSGTLRQNREELRQHFSRLVDTLRVEPFEIEAFRVAVMELQDGMQKRIEIGEELLYGQIEAMSAEERAVYADALERGLRRGPKLHREPPPPPREDRDN